MGAEEDRPPLAEMSFMLTGRGRRIRDVIGGNLARTIAQVLFEDAAWPTVEVRAESSLNLGQSTAAATVRFHPTDRRRLVVLCVDGSGQWSVLRNVDHTLTVAEATGAAVRFVARVPLDLRQRLDPIGTAEVERIVAHRERTRMVGCDCGGLRLRVPHVASFCWRERVDPARRSRSYFVGKPMTRRERIVDAIERLTFGLI